MAMTFGTPAHDYVAAQLLALGGDRPPEPAGLVAELGGVVRDGLMAVLDRMPAGARLSLHKGAIDALACDGRYLDSVDGGFTWSPRAVRGKLVHRAIEVDWGSRRGFDPSEVVARAWHDLGADQTKLTRYLETLDPMTVSLLRHDAERAVTGFRDAWPLLPDRWAAIRLEERMKTVVLGTADRHGRRSQIVLDGKPDLTVSSTIADDRCRQLLVDLKTGARYEDSHRQQMRFYALLATLKYKRPPFRWATFYLDEGEADVEELEPDLLRGAARRAVDAAERAATLHYRRPPDEQLELTAGAYCGWCGRRPECATAAEAWDRRPEQP